MNLNLRLSILDFRLGTQGMTKKALRDLAYVDEKNNVVQ
jgi:hypothetical protein